MGSAVESEMGMRSQCYVLVQNMTFFFWCICQMNQTMVVSERCIMLSARQGEETGRCVKQDGIYAFLSHSVEVHKKYFKKEGRVIAGATGSLSCFSEDSSVL